MERINIIVAGIGAIGGYYGAKLAKFYQGSDVHICFYARGRNEEVIREKGIYLETPSEQWVAYPYAITHDASALEKADILICCSKSYDLLGLIEELKPVIRPSTVLLPILNGVDFYAELKKRLPGNLVLYACTYIISRLVEPGHVKVTSELNLLHLGSDQNSAEAERLKALLTNAGIVAEVKEDIIEKIWEKYFLISAMATATSYFDTSIGSILQDPEKEKMLEELMHEFKRIADEKAIGLPDDMVAKGLSIFSAVPFDATSSMHSDFQAKKRTELESLTGYMVRSAAELNVDVPVYEKMYEALKRTSLQEKE